jgi:hypothetical protein
MSRNLVIFLKFWYKHGYQKTQKAHDLALLIFNISFWLYIWPAKKKGWCVRKNVMADEITVYGGLKFFFINYLE